VGKKFAESMTGALSYCHRKGHSATSGIKLSEGVRAVCLSFKGNMFAEFLSMSPSDKGCVTGKVISNRSSSSSLSSQPQPAPKDLTSVPAMAQKADLSTKRSIYDLYGVHSPPHKNNKTSSTSRPRCRRGGEQSGGAALAGCSSAPKGHLADQ